MAMAIVALIAFALLFFFLRPAQRDFGGLSELELQRYIAYTARALADGGWVRVQVEGFSAPIGIKKEVLKRGSNLIVQVSSGEHSRESIQAVADLLESKGIDYRLTFSRKRRLPRWTEVKLQIDDPLMPSSCTHVIQQMSTALGATGDTFAVSLWGPFAPGFPATDGDVIPHPKSHNFGFVLGSWIGSLLRVFRPRS